MTTLIELLRDNPDPTEKDIRIGISGNLCRCTGYHNIVVAALDAAKRMRSEDGRQTTEDGEGHRDRASVDATLRPPSPTSVV